MALIFANAGDVRCQEVPMKMLRKGASKSINITGSSKGMFLPVDANGDRYGAYRVVASTQCWWNASSAAPGVDFAVPGAPNNYLLNPGNPDTFAFKDSVITINVIRDTGGPAGWLCVSGIM